MFSKITIMIIKVEHVFEFFRIRGTEYEEKHTPLKMKPDAPGRFPAWYMQMYNTQHIEHVKLEEDSVLTDLSKKKQTVKNKKEKKYVSDRT